VAAKLHITGDDCQSCGACCMPDEAGDVYVDLAEDDVLRLSPAFRQRAVVDLRATTGDPWLSLRTKRDDEGHCVCIALQGTIGARVSCSIYERRPDGCRDYQPGTTDCRQARRNAGLE
jgi:Fe-S-cluster containining protein